MCSFWALALTKHIIKFLNNVVSDLFRLYVFKSLLTMFESYDHDRTRNYSAHITNLNTLKLSHYGLRLPCLRFTHAVACINSKLGSDGRLILSGWLLNQLDLPSFSWRAKTLLSIFGIIARLFFFVKEYFDIELPLTSKNSPSILQPIESNVLSNTSFACIRGDGYHAMLASQLLLHGGAT